MSTTKNWREAKSLIKRIICAIWHKPELYIYEDWDEATRKRFDAGVAYRCTKCIRIYDSINLVNKVFTKPPRKDAE